MNQHTALLPLPHMLREHGINVVELGREADLKDGTRDWTTQAQGYYWTDENDRHFGYIGEPNGWAWHHTATYGYTPNVRNVKGQTKTNLYMGLMRNGRLYHGGGGIPTTVFASAGPANYSNGSGVRDVLESNVIADERFYGPQRRPDDSPKWYGNRYYGSTEIVHPGDGSPLDQGVFRMAYITMSVISEHFAWSPWRHIGHLDHTRRKIDPRFEQGSPYTIGFMQDVSQGYTRGVVVPGKDEMILPDLPPFAGYRSRDLAYLRENVEIMQRELSGQGYPDPRSLDKTPCRADGYHGPGTQSALNSFKADNKLPQDATCDDATWRVLLRAN